MTAEIAILNREAVAMASDSAATFSDGTSQKISSSANKIFALSKHYPVGIMIYGNALFMGVPWEVIIKVYRKKLGSTPCSTLYEYGQIFIEFLKGELKLFPEKEQEKYATQCIYSFFHRIKIEITDSIEEEINKKGKIDESEIVTISDNIISNDLEIWKTGTSNIKNPDKQREEIKKKYKDIIGKAELEVFEKLPLSVQSRKDIREIVSLLFITFPKIINFRGVSGIVISGFGEDEIFPSIVSFSIEGIVNNILKYKEDEYTSVSYDTTAIIQPFAQQEMVATFIDGISPNFSRLYYTFLKEIIENYPEVIIDKIAPSLKPNKKKEIIDNINKVSNDNLRNGLSKIQDIQRKFYVDPILNVVTFLPKNELADMAESLVNLTCLRKKISMDDETVGGPIDVAVISKGDGLIWIKRKHYFEPKLNQHFFVNYLNK